MKKLTLKSLDQHCFELAYIFFELRHRYNQRFLQHQTSEWLNIAAGLETIRFDSRKLYLAASGGNIDIDYQLYEKSRRKNSDLVFELIRFELIWNGLKCLEQNLESGMSGLTTYLSHHYNSLRNLDGYNTTLQTLKRLSRKHGYRIRRRILEGQTCCIGLNLVAELRPFFIRCAYAFPFSHQIQLDEGTDPQLVRCSARIVLMSLQMALLTLFAGREDRIDSWWHSDRKDRSVITHAMLRTLHLSGDTMLPQE